jgi:hypothetical protein
VTRRAPPKVPLHPEGQRRRDAIAYLTSLAEWSVLIEHLKAREFEAWWKSGHEDAGAFQRVEGRRSLIAELEALPKRLTDDGPGDSNG